MTMLNYEAELRKPQDIDLLRAIKHLLYAEGFTIREIGPRVSVS